MKFLPAQVQTFRSWRRFAAAVVSDGLLARYTVILFDVFDTLLFRSLAPYDCVLDAVVNELRWLAGQRGLMVRKDPRAARDEAYRILGARAVDSGFDHETNLQELVPLWTELVLGGPSDSVCDIAEKLVRRELECEKALIYPNPAMCEVVDRLRREERRLVFVSDMYLGFDHTKKLLDVNGFADVFDAGYVSGDYLLLKRTGRLYTKLLAEEGVPPNQIIHIGDDPYCDGTMAARHGICACVIRDKTEDRRLRKVSYDVRRYRRDPAWAGPIVSGLVEEMADDIKHHEQLLGLRLLGPVYTAFAHTLGEKCRDANVNRIYFIAREGFLLKRLFDLIAPALWPNGDGPKSLYLCVSRLTAFLASSPRLDLRGLSSILFNKADVSIREVLTPFGLPDGLLLAAAARYGIADVDVPLLRPAWSWPPLHRLLQDNEVAKIIKTRFSEGRALLEEYLEQMGFFAPGTAAIVDLGWNGQIQDNLHQAFGHRQDFPRAEGFYFGLTANGMARQTLVSTLTPLVANQTRFVWNANAAFLCVQILEALTRAPHGTVINYSREEQGTIPVFKAEDTDPRQSEKKSDRLIAAIQFGVLSYAQAYVRAQRVLGFSAKHSLPYACTVLNRFMRGVKHAEAACLLQVGIALDLGSEAVTVHKTGPLGTYNPIKWLWRLFRLVSGSMWPHATLALKGGRILKTLYTVQQVLFEARTRRAFAGSKVDLRPDPSLAHSPCAEVALEEWCEYHDRRMDEQFRATLKQLNQNSEYGRIRAKLTIRDIIFLEWTRICTVLTCHILKMDRPENDGIPLGPYLWWRLARWLRGIL